MTRQTTARLLPFAPRQQSPVQPYLPSYSPSKSKMQSAGLSVSTEQVVYARTRRTLTPSMFSEASYESTATSSSSSSNSSDSSSAFSIAQASSVSSPPSSLPPSPAYVPSPIDARISSADEYTLNYFPSVVLGCHLLTSTAIYVHRPSVLAFRKPRPLPRPPSERDSPSTSPLRSPDSHRSFSMSEIRASLPPPSLPTPPSTPGVLVTPNTPPPYSESPRRTVRLPSPPPLPPLVIVRSSQPTLKAPPSTFLSLSPISDDATAPSDGSSEGTFSIPPPPSLATLKTQPSHAHRSSTSSTSSESTMTPTPTPTQSSVTSSLWHSASPAPSSTLAPRHDTRHRRSSSASTIPRPLPSVPPMTIPGRMSHTNDYPSPISAVRSRRRIGEEQWSIGEHEAEDGEVGIDWDLIDEVMASSL
ncbi:hypothetical protein EVG20_g925 [Dentipellis fragilis]|uniref:Uncharacterized protein n=1 Tax=Dentipellis fragilis TaxID=205917 RepID=A0A4Y9ZF70_9AGAM|nr:hypothetical protein EVG20_g925 [Dentipellis fragilis]